MTGVEFHTGVADKLGFACRLVRKAWRSGKRVVVTGAPEPLDQLDALLWIFEQGEFVPHARLRAGQAIAPLLARTPIWLADAPVDALAGGAPAEVLINLGPDLAADAGRFERLIEIVADAADDIASGRQRWRSHVAAGLTPTNHKQAGS